MADNAPY